MTINRGVIPNWAAGVDQTLSFKTHIFRAEDGTEVRTATSLEPRVGWKFTATMFNNKNTGDRFLPGRNDGSQQRVPDPVEKMKVVIQSGVFTVPSVSYANGDFGPKYSFEDDDILYVAGHDFCEVTDVSVVAASPSGAVFGVTLSNPPVDGTHEVHLTRAVRHNTKGSSSLLTSRVAQRKVDLNMQPPLVRSYLMESDLEFPQYRGYPLFDFHHNWRVNPKHDISYEVRGLDTSYGLPFFRQVGQMVNESTFHVSVFTQADAKTIMAQFIQSRGRHAPFYAPMALPSVVLSEPAVEGLRLIRTDTPPEELAVWDMEILRNLMLEGPSRQPVGIVDIRADGAGSIIEFDDPVKPEAAGAMSVGWLAKCRFSNDELKIKWETNTKAEISFGVTALIDSFHEIRMQGFRIMFNGNYVVFPSVEFPDATVTNKWDDE
jgi:hypothetical protein